MPTPIIDVRGAGVAFDGRPALTDVDFGVNEGEAVTLLGANGSGKSTLVRAIVGLVEITSGSIELFGQPARSFRDWQRVGYVPQRTTAAGGVPATVREVVTSGRLARRALFRPLTRADREAVDRAIELVGLTDRARDSVTSLSGGQQQRTLIARAAAAEPDLMVLDEPNAGIDQPSQEAFARTLRTFVAAGHTVLLVLHELGPLAPLINRGVVLEGGRVVHDGPIDVEISVSGGTPDHHDAGRHPDGQEGLFR